MKSLFEQMSGTYTQQGDYFLPDLKLPTEGNRPVGVWGQRRQRYLKEHRPILYTNLHDFCCCLYYKFIRSLKTA